jgi:hypothetical protein
MKKDAGVVPSTTAFSWVFPRKEGLTVVYNNTVYTQSGQVVECGLNLTDWQRLSVYNDPGSTVGVTPDDDTLIAAARAVLGLGPAPPPCSEVSYLTNTRHPLVLPVAGLQARI